MSRNINRVIAFNYFGGKFTWLDLLYENFPSEFTHLAELFGGSFCVSLNYKGKIVRTANEINGEITNFFEVLRDHEGELMRRLLLTPCSQLEYNNCWGASEDKIERARRFYVRIRQSFFSLGAQRKNKGWHMAKSSCNVNGGETVSKWNNALAKLYAVAEVIRENFQITNLDYKECIDRIDHEGAFFYCDPPYPEETRASFNVYKYEFSREDHIDLAERLHRIKGLAMVSSYRSDLYDELYADWRRVEFPTKKNNIRSSEVKEVIWMNYENTDRSLFNQNI